MGLHPMHVCKHTGGGALVVAWTLMPPLNNTHTSYLLLPGPHDAAVHANDARLSPESRKQLKQLLLRDLTPSAWRSPSAA